LLLARPVLCRLADHEVDCRDERRPAIKNTAASNTVVGINVG